MHFGALRATTPCACEHVYRNKNHLENSRCTLGISLPSLYKVQVSHTVCAHCSDAGCDGKRPNKRSLCYFCSTPELFFSFVVVVVVCLCVCCCCYVISGLTRTHILHCKGKTKTYSDAPFMDKR